MFPFWIGWSPITESFIHLLLRIDCINEVEFQMMKIRFEMCEIVAT